MKIFRKAPSREDKPKFIRNTIFLGEMLEKIRSVVEERQKVLEATGKQTS